MCTPEAARTAGAALLLVLGMDPALAKALSTPGLGQPLPAAERARLDAQSIYPDGRGLPEGRGTVAEGRALYAQRCAACHGAAGRGGSGGVLISGEPLDAPDADAGIDNYWPYATTLFDFTRRAMPMDAPGSLSNDEVYAVTGYLLNLAGIVGPDETLDAASLAAVKMPNRNGFVWIDGPKRGASAKSAAASSRR